MFIVYGQHSMMVRHSVYCVNIMLIIVVARRQCDRQ